MIEELMMILQDWYDKLMKKNVETDFKGMKIVMGYISRNNSIGKLIDINGAGCIKNLLIQGRYVHPINRSSASTVINLIVDDTILDCYDAFEQGDNNYLSKLRIEHISFKHNFSVEVLKNDAEYPYRASAIYKLMEE